jgi:hypothetical protein
MSGAVKPAAATVGIADGYGGVKLRPDANIPQDNAREQLAISRIPFREISYAFIPLNKKPVASPFA